MSQIELQRRDRHMAVGDGVEVGTFARIARAARRPDPVDRFAAWVGLRYYRLRRMPLAETGDLPLADLLVRQIGNVDVEQRVPGQRMLEIMGDDFRGDTGRGVEMSPIL